MVRAASDFLALFSRLYQRRFGHPYYSANKVRDLSFLRRLRDHYGEVPLKLMIGKFIEDVDGGLNPNIVTFNQVAPKLATRVEKTNIATHPHYELLRKFRESS